MSNNENSNIKEDTAAIPLNSNANKFINTVLNLNSNNKYSDVASQQYSKLIQNKINSSLLPTYEKKNINSKKDGLNKLTHASIFEKKNFDSLNLNTMKLKNFQEVNTRVNKQANRYKSQYLNTQQLAIMQEALENYTKASKVDDSYHKIRMGFESGVLLKNKDIDEVFQYNLNVILKLSNSVNPDLSFFEPIMGELVSIIEYELNNDEIISKSTFLTCILILRNLSQDSTVLTYLIKNLMSSLISMINHVLDYSTLNSNSYNLLDIRLEALQYSLDLLENLALFITNNKANDTESEGTINTLFKNILIIYDEYYHSLDSKILIPILTTFARYITKSDSDFKGFVSMDFIKKNINILLTFDKTRENLTIAVLDFLQQYISNDDRFAYVSNGEHKEILKSLKSALINTITPEYMDYSSLDNHIKERNNKNILSVEDVKQIEPEVEYDIPVMPKHVFERLLQLDDPERSKVFLRCLFEPSLNEEFPQIKLWRVYNDMFKEKVLERGGEMITAINYIKSVPTVIYGASAIVKYDENKNKKFVIQHLKPRKFCIDLDVANESMDTIFLFNESLADTNTNNKKKFDVKNFFNSSSNEEIMRISVILLKKVLSVFDKDETKTVLKGLIKLNPQLVSEFKEMV